MLESWSGEPAPSRALPSPELFVFIVFATLKDAFEMVPVLGSTGEVFDVDDPEHVTGGCD